jgi:succinate dehydrogenase / fumarate reductase iron-sulfur subunit
MVAKMDELGFGSCTNQYECSAACPKQISHDFIARLNREFIGGLFQTAFAPTSNASGGAG